MWADCPFLTGVDKQRMSGQVPGLSFDVTREKAAASKVGVFFADWWRLRLADSGRLSSRSAPGINPAPNIHIAVVQTDRLVPDLPAVLGKIRPEQTNYISFITGPSRTADIERVLTIGVHGPEKLVIVFVDQVFVGLKRPG